MFFNSALTLIVVFCFWALLHSIFASRPVKRRARSAFGEDIVARWYRLAYNVFSTVTFIPYLIVLAWGPDFTLYVVPAPWRWLMVAGQLLAVIGLVATLRQTGVWHFLGLSQIVVETPSEEPAALQVTGVYRWVRHPLYTFSLLLIWLTPVMTTNVLITCILFALYFYVGSIHEERRLLAEFGDAYREYRQRVPRLVPKFPSRSKATTETR